MARRGPFAFETVGGREDEEAIMFTEHLHHVVDRYIQEPKRRRKPEAQPDEIWAAYHRRQLRIGST